MYAGGLVGGVSVGAAWQPSRVRMKNKLRIEGMGFGLRIEVLSELVLLVILLNSPFRRSDEVLVRVMIMT